MLRPRVSDQFTPPSRMIQSGACRDSAPTRRARTPREFRRSFEQRVSPAQEVDAALHSTFDARAGRRFREGTASRFATAQSFQPLNAIGSLSGGGPIVVVGMIQSVSDLNGYRS